MNAPSGLPPRSLEEALQLLAQGAWQGAAVGLVALAVVTWGRRWPSPLRYWILVLALLKFAMPPLVSLPTGIFALVRLQNAPPADSPGPPLVAEEPETDNPAAGTPTADRTATPSSGPAAPVSEPRAGANDVPDSLIDHRGPAPHRASAGRVPVEARAGWPLVALWIYGFGVLFTLVSFAVRGLVLHRRVRRMAEPPPPIIRQARQIAVDLGMRGMPRLRLSPNDAVPYSVGILFPFVVLPERHPRELSPGQLRSVLCHELAHHRRGDLWVNLLQVLIGAAWWFHPVVWLLNRSIRTIREDCCDDLILSRRLVTDEGYCAAILRVAEGCIHRRRIGIGVSMADGLHPLSARIRRIMDQDIARRDRLGRLATAGLVMAAAIVLPGVRVATTTAAPGAGSEFQQEPAEGPLTADVHRMRIRAIDETGRPVRAATVVLRAGDGMTRFTTDDDGSAVVEYPRSIRDRIIVDVAAERFVPVRAAWNPGAGRPDLPPADFDFRLSPSRIAGGRVVDERGSPVPGATIRLRVNIEQRQRERVQPLTEYETETGADGIWRLTCVPRAAVPTGLQVTHSDFVSDAFSVSLDAGERDRVLASQHERTLIAGVPLSGTVTDSAGVPIEGALVALSRTPWIGELKTWTDSGGRYRFAHCPSGQSTLVVFRPGLAPELQFVTFHADSEGEERNVRVGPGNPIRVRVTDRAGRPLAGAKVVPSIWRGSLAALWRLHEFGETNADGIWTWDWAPEDAIEYRVIKAGYMTADRLPLAPAREQHEVVLLSELRIRGKVVDDDTGEPIQSFRVIPGTFHPKRSQPEAWRRDEAVNGTAGLFSLHSTNADDRHIFRIEANNYEPATSRTILGEEENATIEIRLKPTRPLYGVVLAPDGSPEPDAHLLLTTSADQAYIRNRWDVDRRGKTIPRPGADGLFRLPAGDRDFVLLVFGATGFAQARAADFRSEIGTPVPITLKPWGRLEGTVQRGDRLLANEEVRLDFMDPVPGHARPSPYAYFDISTKTDSAGRFQFDRIPPDWLFAAYHAVFLPRGEFISIGRGASALVRLAPGEVREVPLGRTGGRTVTGRAEVPPDANADVDWRTWYGTLNPRGKPPAEAFVLRSPGHFLLERDGSFRIEGVLPGEYLLTIQTYNPANRTDRTQPVTIPSPGRRVTIETAPPGAPDEPFDIGTFTVTPPPVSSPGQ